MPELHIDETLRLCSLTIDDAPILFATLEANRSHLDRWLRWSGRLKSIEDCTAYIQRFSGKERIGDGFHAGLWRDGQLAGGFVCHFINRESNKTEIGYWLAERFVGSGIITRTCQTMLTYLFEHEHMHRIEIQTTVDNVSSRAVAERLGFQLEGIKRESDWITDSYRDHTFYALLAQDWHA